MIRTPSGDVVRVAPTAALVALSVVTTVLLGRLFDGDAYLRPTLAMVLGVHALSLVLRWSRWPAIIAVPVVGVVGAVLAAVVLYRTTLSGPLPTPATLEAVGADLRTVLDRFRTAVAPVPDSGAFATITALAMAMVAASADALAFRAGGRFEAVVPSGVMFLLVAALGTGDTDVAVVTLWIAAAVLVVATLRFASWADGGCVGGRTVHWAAPLPAMISVATVCALVAGVAGPRLPGADAAPLIDPDGAGTSVTEVVSPLIGIGARLTTGGGRELFSISSSDGPHYWRVMALDDFDGANWSPSEESLTRADDSAASAMGDVAGARVDQVITVAALGGHLVPAAHVAVAVSPDSVLFAPRSESLVKPDVELQRGDVLTVRSRVLRPTIGQLRASGVTRAPALSMYSVPSSIPEAVHVAAFEVTSNAATPYDRAIALQDWFRETGGFTYDLEVDYGSGPGAIADFLDRRVGFCQQFATTYAAMARIVGLPARVVVGFTPGDVDTNGTFHVYGRHAHAWPEVWFDGMGWVAFEPTPGRGSPDGVGYLPGVVPGQDDSGTAATDPGATDPTDPGSTTTSPASGSTTTTGGPTPPSSAPGTTAAGAGAASTAGGSPATPIVIVATALLCLVAGVLLARRTRRQHAPGSPEAVVARAWWAACRDLRLAGAAAPGGATPVEYAPGAAAGAGVDSAPVVELARLVTRAAYAPSPVDDEAADRSRDLSDRIRAACLATATPWVRLRARLLPDGR